MKRLFSIITLAMIVTLVVAAVEMPASTVYAAENTGLSLKQSSSPLMTPNAWNALGSGLNGIAFAIAVDGTDIYVGGSFTDAGGDANADHIAKWNGASWSALGTGLNGTVRTIVINGSDLYVGGEFTDAGGDSNADYVARWDGASWSTLGTGVNNTVHVIAVSGSNVYIGGLFTNASGNPDADYIAKLDGDTWGGIGSTPLNGTVYTVVLNGGEVYAGGAFQDAGGDSNADRIAKWNGASWSALGSGLNNTVQTIVLNGGNVFAGGDFINAGGNAAADYIARWNGTSWSDVGGGLSLWVRTIAINGTGIYVGGYFENAGGDANADKIAKWDGTSWSALGTTPLNNQVNRIVINGLDLYAGGGFTDAGGNANADYIARFETDVSAPTVTSFTALSPSPSLDIPITAFTASDDAAVAGYLITEAATPPSAGAAGWTVSVPTAHTVGSDGSYTLYPWAKDAAGNVSAVYGSPASVSVDTTPPTLNTNTWNALGNGLSNTTRSIAMNGTDVYTAGSFLDAGSYVNGDRIAKWNGTSWSPLGAGLNGQVNTVVVSGSSIYAGGDFINAGGEINASSIAEWNGSTWSALGDGLNGTVLAMAVNGTDLYVGGSFTNAGGDANADYIAKWDGTAWSALGTTPLTDFVQAIAISGADVYVGGSFTDAGGNLNADRIAKWNGSTWSALGDGLNGTVLATAVNGTDLYVGGTFTDAGGDANADRIAKWNGSTWSALGDGLNGIVFATAVNGTDLYVGGDFTNAGGDAIADRIAKWNGSTWSALGTTPLNNTVHAVATSGLDVYASGSFTDAGGNLNADRIARFVLDGTAPTVTSFTAPSSSPSLNIPISAFTASDNVAVAGYLITETATSPSADAAGWTGSAPTAYAVASNGSYILYPWVKDAAGNVSAVYGSPANVTVDTTKPTVNSFTATSPSSSLNVTITAFTASDNVAVTGYQITESSTPPSAGAAGWVASAPTNHTVSDYGSYALYPWAKDAAGNVSAVYGSPVAVTVCLSGTITVTSSANSGAGTLRKAISDACAGSTINFNSALSGDTIHLASTLTLTKDVAIDGSSLATPITLSGDSDSNGTGDVRVLQVNSGVTATLDSLIIINGNASGNVGGGIRNQGTLTVNNSTISNNSASWGGGGIFSNNGTLTVTNSTFSGNNGGAGGGGIYSSVPLAVTNSTFSGNSGALGGGIALEDFTTATVINSTFSGNSASNKGGGIFGHATLTVTNSTLSGNSATASGGGIYSTASGTLNYTNTIIANSSSGGDCVNDGTLGTNTNNLVEDGSCSAFLSGDPNLGVLTDNGGPTQTVALLSDSPAIDAGVNANCPATDQRGVTRPFGSHCDIGAYEFSDLADIQVEIAGVNQGNYNLPPQSSIRDSYPGVDNGPVKVESTNGVSIVAAVRNAWSQNGVVESWSQLMGLPDTQLSTTYYFPAYNNVTLSDQLRFANLGNAQTTVTVEIGSVVNESYVLQAGESLRVSYPGVDSGPVTVSSDGQLIIAALRNAWSQNGVVESWVQLMGLPASQLSTTYYFPAYNNVTLSDQLRFANLGNAQTTVTVEIGSVVNESYVLQAGESLRVSYPGVDDGPVTVSSDGEPIIAALRNAWSQNGIVQSWAQMMGLPDTQLSDTYYFPAYNNVTLSDQLRLANLGNAQTTVTVEIGSVVNESYVLQAGESLRVSYPGVDSGPVTVSSDGQPIIAALRNAWSQNGVVESWVQLMGLPASQLSDTYYFPAYNNVTLSDQLRIAVP